MGELNLGGGIAPTNGKLGAGIITGNIKQSSSFKQEEQK